ncbi:MAG: hypothetical protein ACOYUZ_01170 [Patescibacteria group bacterium]
MYSFATCVAMRLDKMTGGKDFTQIAEAAADPLKKVRFEAGQVARSCKDLCKALEIVAVEIEMWDQYELDKQVAGLLAKIVCTAQKCAMENLAGNQQMKAMLTGLFSMLLQGLLGNDIRKAVAESRARQMPQVVVNLNINAGDIGNALQKWGLLMTEPAVVMVVAEVIADLPEEQRPVFLTKLSYIIGSLENKPDAEAVRFLAQQALSRSHADNN